MENETTTDRMEDNRDSYTEIIYGYNDTTRFNYPTLHSFTLPPEERYVLGVAAGLLFLFGVFGNVLTLVATAHDKSLRKSKVSWFVASLSASDLLACLTVLPLAIIDFFQVPTVLSSYPYAHATCAFANYIQAATSTASLMVLLLITLNRYVAIVQNHWLSTLYGRKSVILQILFIWTSVYATDVQTLFGVNYVAYVDEQTLHCSIRVSKPEDQIRMLEVLRLVIRSSWSCIVYILIMVGCYIHIFWHVRQSRKLVESFGDEANRAKRQSGSNNTELKLAKTMMITLLVLLLSATPEIWCQVYGVDNVWPGFFAVALICVQSTYTTNVLIYAASHPQYRRAYINLFQKLGGCMK